MLDKRVRYLSVWPGHLDKVVDLSDRWDHVRDERLQPRHEIHARRLEPGDVSEQFRDIRGHGQVCIFRGIVQAGPVPSAGTASAAAHHAAGTIIVIVVVIVFIAVAPTTQVVFDVVIIVIHLLLIVVHVHAARDSGSTAAPAATGCYTAATAADAISTVAVVVVIVVVISVLVICANVSVLVHGAGTHANDVGVTRTTRVRGGGDWVAIHICISSIIYHFIFRTIRYIRGGVIGRVEWTVAILLRTCTHAA